MFIVIKKSILPILIVLLVSISLVLCLYNLGEFPIQNGDETTHAKVMQEMVIDNNWLSPTISGKPYYNKPPFKMWLSALVVKGFGETNFNYRVVDGVSGFLLIIATCFVGYSLFNSILVGIFAGFAIISAHELFFDHGIRLATQDTFVNLLITINIYFVCRILKGDQSLRNYLSIGILAGIGVLTKSIIGLFPYYILVTAFLYFQIVQGEKRINIKLLLISLAIAIFIPSLYFVPHFIFNSEAIKIAVNNEVYERVTQGYHNQTQFWFYLRKIYAKNSLIPPSLLTLSLLIVIIKDKLQFTNIILGIWGVLTVIIFSIIPSRLLWYIYPAMPAFAIMVGRAIEILFSSYIETAKNWKSPKFLAGLLLLVFIFSQLYLGIRRNFFSVVDDNFRADLEMISIDNKGIVVGFEDGMPLGRPEIFYLSQLRAKSYSFDKLVELYRDNKLDLIYFAPRLSSEDKSINIRKDVCNAYVSKKQLGRKTNNLICANQNVVLQESLKKQQWK